MSFNAVTNTPCTIVISGGGWYPDIPVAEFQNLYRLPQEYAAELVANHLELAAVWAQRQLEGWQAEQRAAGCAGIEAAGSHAALLYRRAVFCHAKGLLLGQFATVERREAARNDAKEGEDMADRFFAWAQNAIADMLRRPRVDVELV